MTNNNHKFTYITNIYDENERAVLALLKSDKICLKCKIIINNQNEILNFTDDEFVDTEIIFNDFLSCEEIQIKHLLE